MSNHDSAEATHPVVPVRTYVLIWLILLGCTGLTYGVALVDLGPWNIVVALMIAFFKMSLVVLFFMHVKQESRLLKMFVAAGFVWLAILLVFLLSDYLSRGWLPAGHMWHSG